MTVEPLKTVEEQAIVRANIRATGAVDYVYNFDVLGGVLELADVLVQRWLRGVVEIVDTDTSAKLYRYWKLRDDRMSPEDRTLVYRRVLAKGDVQASAQMVVNESFPRLWHELLAEITRYSRASEEAATDASISKTPIFQATEALQLNLSQYGAGIVQVQVTEMYAQLREALELLGSREVVAQFSAGRRNNVWMVIEHLAKEEFDRSLDIALVRTLAVEGNRVFEWIANYNPRSVSDESFRMILEAAENWLMAAAGLEGGGDVASRSGEEEEEDFRGFEDEDEDAR